MANVTKNQQLYMKHSVFFLLFITLCACSKQAPKSTGSVEVSSKGGLFIIGGGNRGEVLMNRLIDEAQLREGGYAFILPMASELPDSAIIWSAESFENIGISNWVGFDFSSLERMTNEKMDSVKAARLIYIAGGDQKKFMEIVKDSPLEAAIHEAYEQGAVIAGTSAGAAIMSKLMITGNELRHPGYNSTFRNLEKNNLELDTGMAFISNAIIDQHFVKRSRYNRLITAVAEYPQLLGIGIDEETAIWVKQDSAEVIGQSQVITFKNTSETQVDSNGKIGLKNLELNVFLPGEKFFIGKND